MTAVEHDVERVLALTPLQEGLLVESLAAPGAGLYVEQVVVDLPRTVVMPAMARAWHAVVERHAVLRTSFHWRDLDRPLQVVHRRARVPVARADLRGRTAAVRSFLEQDRRLGFAFDRAPLLRVAVLDGAGPASRLVVTLHHVLLDGWSFGIVLDEVSRLYEAFRSGRPLTLAPAPDFGEFVAWLGEQDPGAAEAFWREELGDHAGAPPLARRVDGHGRAAEHRELTVALTEAEATAARDAARAARVTLNTLVLGAWAIVLGAELRTDDLVVGTVVSGREAPVHGIEAMVGLCINTIPVRVRLPPAAPVADWLAGLQARQLASREHQHCALTTVHGWSAIPRGRPLFESIFIFENHATGGRRASAQAFERTGAPLTVIVGVTDGLSVRILHDLAAVGADAVERLAGRLRAVLAELAADTGAALGEVGTLRGPERERVLAFGRGATAAIPDRRVHERILTQPPGAVALIAGEREVTFGELARDAEAAAAALRTGGAGPGTVVAIGLERSVEAVVAILAAWLAGAAYLPLEPSLPPERRRFVLADSGAALEVTADGLVPHAGTPGPAPDDLAWVLSTSGSSGRPKAVPGTHRGLANRLAWGERAQPFRPGDVAMAKTRLAFVDSVAELMAPLAAGVPVVLADEPTAADPVRLARLVADAGVTRLVVVPSLLRVLLEVAPDALRGSRLRLVTASGEPLDGADARAFARVLPGCELWNLYGSTEVAADATAHRVIAPEPGRVPIGRPLDNVAVTLTDPHGRLVPAGVVGEITVGGAGVAPGYLGHAASENHRFTAHGYRTGDLGRWRPDGTLEHHGRADRQVKLRGIRVEPDELEQVLGRHPAVAEAAVVVLDGPDGPVLAAAYAASARVREEDLREHLLDRLPAQLVPARLTELPVLPRLPSGKLDRQALAALRDGDRRAEPPRNAAERAVAEAFGGVLGAADVGAFDDFFALGGHSLLAIRLVSALNARFGVDLPLGTVFGRPVVADLAAEVEGLLLEQIRAEPAGG